LVRVPGRGFVIQEFPKHHLYVVTGKLRTGPVRDPVDLAAGDYIRFPLMSPIATSA